MASEQFSLCWDNFHKNMSSGMQSLLESEDLVDVTLAVEGRYLKAHKMVLSVCSPYFRELFQSNPCKHPIVFMKDVSYIALSDLLQFMYQGEVQVAQENLTTFIKTAEALQIKGLTGDSNSQNESETPEPPEIEKPAVETIKRSPEAIVTKPVPTARVKKPAGPASKRPRFILPAAESSSVMNPVAASTPVVTTTKAEASSASAAPTSDEIIQFKMEPSESADQSHVEGIDDSNADRYGDESAIDDMQDDTEDYSLMETGDDEPKAGTSADGMGDGQDESAIYQKPVKRKRPHMAFIKDGFVYHQNSRKANSRMRYLACSEYKKLVCHARATIPIDGPIEALVVTREHNHPPARLVAEKNTFIKQLKSFVQFAPHCSLKEIYRSVEALHPQAAEVCPYNKLLPSMRRWRSEALVCFTKDLNGRFSIKQEKKRKKRVNTRMRFVVDGFVYHNNLIAGSPPLRYLGCAEHKRAGCRGRATLPLNGTIDQLKLTQPHNHPPDMTAEEKQAFVRELKNAVRTMENSTLKNVYQSVAEIYPRGALEISFKSISSSLHRWRHNPNM